MDEDHTQTIAGCTKSREICFFFHEKKKVFSIVWLRKHLLLIHAVLKDWLVAVLLWRWIDLASNRSVLGKKIFIGISMSSLHQHEHTNPREEGVPDSRKRWHKVELKTSLIIQEHNLEFTWKTLCFFPYLLMLHLNISLAEHTYKVVIRKGN